ncbi:hypothetical protein DIPPA_05129 [Diplonema papillatum]|nr:hypothetical protein DIPPA_05129 [Diplonema papillatum]
MSIARSRIGQKEDVDPYALSDDDDAAAAKKAQKAKAARRRRPAAGGPGKAAPADAPALLPASDPEAIVAVEEECALDYADAENRANMLATVCSELTVPIRNAAASRVWTYTSARPARRLQWKDSQREDQATGRPDMRYVRLGNHDFQAQRQWTDDQYVLFAPTARQARLCKDGPFKKVIRVQPTKEWRYVLMPHHQDATRNVSSDEIQRLMMQQRWKTKQLDAVLEEVNTTPAQQRAIQQACSEANYDTLTRDRFSEVWERVRDKVPSGVILDRIFGRSHLTEMGVEQVIVKLKAISRGGMDGEGVSGEEEEEQRIRRAQAREEDADQDNIEEVEGNEKVFDDDAEDQPDLDPDQSNVDLETREYGTQFLDEAREAASRRHLRPADTSAVELDDFLAEEDEIAKASVQRAKLMGLVSPDDPASDADAAADADPSTPPPPAEDTPPAEVPTAPKPPVTQGVTDPAARAGKVRKRAADGDATPPAAARAAKRVKKAADPDAALLAEVDDALRKLFNKGPRGGRKGPAVVHPLPVVEREVIRTLSEPRQKREEALAKEKAGSIPSAAEYLRQFTDRWRKAVRTRVDALGGTVSSDNVVTL